MTQAALIPDAVPAGPPAKRPRGWAALALREHVVELDQPNATGRRQLTFRYRAQLSWRDKPLATAEELLTEYFRVFGGFRVVDQAIITAWYQALGDYAESEIRAAMAAKLRSMAADTPEERRAKRMYVVAPVNFPSKIAYWHSQSDEQRDAIARADRFEQAAHRKDLDALAERAADRERRLTATLQAQDAERNAAQEAERVAKREREADRVRIRRVAHWEGLEKHQRETAMAAVVSQSRARGTYPTADQLLDQAQTRATLLWPPTKEPPQ